MDIEILVFLGMVLLTLALVAVLVSAIANRNRATIIKVVLGLGWVAFLVLALATGGQGLLLEYAIFLTWLLYLTIRAYSEVSAPWKAVLFSVWLVIFSGLYVFLFPQDQKDIGLFFLAGLLIGVGIAALAVPLTIASLSSSDSGVRQTSSRLSADSWSSIKWLCVLAGLIMFVLGFFALFSALLLFVPIALLFQVLGTWLATNTRPRYEPDPENA